MSVGHQKPEPAPTAEKGLALYIHWPFCLSKCPYCDFNSHVRQPIPSERFVRALRQELFWEAQRLGPRRLTSIFFGGGTPSLMPPSGVADLIADARTYFPTEEEPEITLEANPTSVETGRLQDFRSAGVNRVSLGIQALNDESLHALGREHSAAQAVAALELARGIFPRVSFDLIYARPGQNEQAWRQELETALSLVSGHLSLYQLTIETGTKFEALFRQGRIILPEEDEAARLYDMTGEIAAKHGLQAYEVSNYAVPGQESRHNLAYWRYRDYAGIGPGAHGRVTPGTEILATRRHRAPEIWAERVEENGTGLSSETVLQAEDLAREMLLMGLRLSSGVDEQAFQARTGCSLLDSVDREILRMCVEEGYLLHEGGTLAATPRGRMLLEAILGRLVL